MSIQMDQAILDLQRRVELLEKQVKSLVSMLEHKPQNQTLSLKKHG